MNWFERLYFTILIVGAICLFPCLAIWVLSGNYIPVMVDCCVLITLLLGMGFYILFDIWRN